MTTRALVSFQTDIGGIPSDVSDSDHNVCSGESAAGSSAVKVNPKGAGTEESAGQGNVAAAAAQTGTRRNVTSQKPVGKSNRALPNNEKGNAIRAGDRLRAILSSVHPRLGQLVPALFHNGIATTSDLVRVLSMEESEINQFLDKVAATEGFKITNEDRQLLLTLVKK
ncbi:hypothetical protein OIO90_000010 [Microbotryomycetes sp. JL221]|nr:hypothetical protein OIO90_000010 [Microbotryomycetes sp. JL221]